MTPARIAWALLALLVCAGASGAGERGDDREAGTAASDEHARGAAEASPMATASPETSPSDAVRPLAREDILGPFLAGYWELPVPFQGEPPAAFSTTETSLDPQVCGACHPQQLAEWKTSLHAGAWSPGFAGQLVEGSLSRPGPLRNCQTCHAPLEEQQPVGADGEPRPDHDAALRAQGIVCAACHVRAHRRFGPPRRSDFPEPQGVVAHGGFEARPEFQQSRFCAQCHQFFDQRGPAGKPVQNTFVEWRESPQASEGRTCQSCHMPDRAHTWRGLHDREMVRAAVDVELRGPEVSEDAGTDVARATLLLTNRDVGHAFPTYVTPRVFVALWQIDAGGAEIEGTRVEAAIGREIDFGSRPAEEVFDTRVRPGESFRLDYAEPRHAEAASLRARVTVDPAHHYRGVFQRLLRRYQDEEALSLIEEALARADRVDYVLTEEDRALR